MSEKNIAITGIGIISPLGIGKEEYWQSLKNGLSGFRQISLFDTRGLKNPIAGEIAGFEPKKILTNINLMDVDRASCLLSCAMKLAIDDSGLDLSDGMNKEIGISAGTTFGSLYSISEFDKEALREGPRYANPSVFTSTVGNSPASRAAIFFKIKGFNSTISTGMTAALDAIDYARDFLNLGRAKAVVAGAVEALSPQIYLGFYKLNYLAGMKNGHAPVSRPFDKQRDGIILSEGSAVFILEGLESAKSRKAKIYAQIIGLGYCFDYAKHYKYNPKGKGMKKAMLAALKNSGLRPSDIDCIFANANSTPEADLIETNAIKEAFAGQAYKIPVTAIKSTLGETYSASGAMSLAAAIYALNNGIIPPTTNLKERDPACDLDYVFNAPRNRKLSKVMVNSFGPNGENAAMVVGKAD